jgi:hypothetical protein
MLDRLWRRLSAREPLALLGQVEAARDVSLTCRVVGGDLVSPVSGRRCAYYHAELGDAVELAWPLLRDRRARHAFRSTAELRSADDLVVTTGDDRRIALPGGFFLVVARAISHLPLPTPMGGLASTSGRPTRYREIALGAGDLVRFSGVVEAVPAPSRSGYRDAPGHALRMRPEREPIVVELAS